MPLTLVATPIGHSQDISLRALEVLKSADVIIVEEFKESTSILRAHGIAGKPYESLNEHSSKEDLKKLADLCQAKNVALITDCGTPGFCDPGAHLVDLCRRKNILIQTIPGPSSLMGLLSLSSHRIDQFLFRGFLPAETQERAAAYRELKQDPRAIVIMDTPYRFQKMLSEIQEFLPERKFLLTVNLTQENELVAEGLSSEVQQHPRLPQKAEFMILLYPDSQIKTPPPKPTIKAPVVDQTKGQEKRNFSRSSPQKGSQPPRRRSSSSRF